MSNKSLEQEMSEWMRAAFVAALDGAGPVPDEMPVVPAGSPEYGDYQCNAAMGLAKALRRNPRQIAQDVVRLAEASSFGQTAVGSIVAVGPGFINITLRDEWLADRVADMGASLRLGVPLPGSGRTVVLDYSSPNVAKPMHIGHIRSTVIGNALDRIFRFLGYNVVSDNHLGDWGTQFGILIMGWKNFLNHEALAQSPIEELERLYVQSNEKARSNPDWLEACRRELVKLQAGDAENLGLWRRFVELSMREFARIYDRLGVSFDLVRGESHYNARLPALVESLVAKGIARESEGATVAFLDDEGLPPCLVRKSDGAFNYATTDLATVQSRIEEFNPEAIIYVTDERQQLHFRQVFAICRRLGVKTKLEHVWFGLMRLPEGTFSTRDGNVIRLERLLDEAEKRALALVRENSPDLDSERQAEVARIVGIGAVKYADLSQNPRSLVVFSWDKALAMNGNSAPYLQYAYARIRSVQEKYAERFPGRRVEDYPIVLDEPMSRAVAARLVRFPDAVLHAAGGYKPSVLADYLFDLASAYSAFYQNVPFLKAPDGARESRVRLCGAVGSVLKQGLGLLGIGTMDRI